MPKQKITRETIVGAAFEIARTSGMEQVMVKAIADKIGCSVQPIYSYCKNMDGLRRDVIERTGGFVREYVKDRIDPEDLFRSMGRAYIRLAKDEPHLFKIFILHQREGISSLEDLYRKETDPRVASWIADQWGISEEQAKQLHLHMLIYTIGIGTIFAVTTPGISADEICAQQEIACQAFLNWVLREGDSDLAERGRL
ncbi:MAG: TetR/AcrR family transcriptional regulator [Lachnospiraceae bacterium]|nr:TetR/AcrR family transcriptional regulator [Lachnospiraceae bacterium]